MTDFNFPPEETTTTSILNQDDIIIYIGTSIDLERWFASNQYDMYIAEQRIDND